MKIEAKSFRDLMSTLIQRGDVVELTLTTTGRTGLVYRLVGGVKEEGEGEGSAQESGAPKVKDGEGR
jgi:hypothetical protein